MRFKHLQRLPRRYLTGIQHNCPQLLEAVAARHIINKYVNAPRLDNAMRPLQFMQSLRWEGR